MNLVDPADIITDILKFKGFMKSSLKDKLKWLFVLYPFALIFVAYHLILWIPALPFLLKNKIKSKRKG